MNVEITGRHIVITPAIESYVLKRLRKLTRIFGDDISFHVIIDVSKDRHTAEILLKSKLLDLTCRGETSDMYASIVRAVEKLERQALKTKSKVIETKRHRAKVKSVAEKSGSLGTSRSRAPRRGNGIMEEDAQKKPMAVEEALLELAQSEYPFVVFRNVDSGAVDVLYKRKDGAVGLIHG
jgi:putative sigma-54 modulation protein